MLEIFKCRGVDRRIAAANLKGGSAVKPVRPSRLHGVGKAALSNEPLNEGLRMPARAHRNGDDDINRGMKYRARALPQHLLSRPSMWRSLGVAGGGRWRLRARA